jgi:hypothetical protein
MFAALQNGDFPSGRLMFQPDAKDIACGVHVTVVDRPAVATLPAPHSKRAHAFGAARGDGPASRARLGTPSFVRLDIHRLPSGSLVSQHVPEAAPTGVKNGLRHPCSGQLRSIYIADDDQRVLPRQLRTGNVKVMTPRVRNFRVDGANAPNVASALRGGKFSFVLPIMPGGRDLLSGRQCGKFLQTEVNAHRAAASRKIVGNLALKNNIPSPACILDKASGSVLTFDLPTLPETEFALEVNGGVSVQFCGPGDEWNPPQGALPAEAGAETRTTAVLISGFGKLTTDLRDGIRVKPQIGCNARCEAAKIEDRRPTDISAALAPPLSFTLRSYAEIPHPIAGYGVATQPTLSALNAIAERKHGHTKPVVVLCGVVKRKYLKRSGDVSYYRCACGHTGKWRPHTVPADCEGCAECWSTLSIDGNHKDRAEHQWDTRYNERTGLPIRRVCRRCLKVEKP